MGSMFERFILRPPRGVRRSWRRAGLAAGLVAVLAVAATPVLAADSAVSIAGFAFGPGSVTVEVGDTVTWTNDDTAPHTATASGDFDTGTIAVGDSASVTFDTAGTYAYVCSIHPAMQGTVVVAGDDAATDPPSLTPAPTDTIAPADPADEPIVGLVAMILGTMGIGMLIGTYLAGRRARVAGD
jgi:plastocyanin